MDKIDFAQSVLKYWYLVEFLDQPNFPAGSINRKSAKEYEGKNQITLSHTFDSKEADIADILTADTQKLLKFHIFSDECCICIGKVKREQLTEYLIDKFALEDNAPEKEPGMICLVGLKCDDKGCYVEKSVSVSPLVWGIAQLQNHRGNVTGEQLSDLLSLESYYSSMLDMEDMLILRQEDGITAGKKLTPDILDGLLNRLIQRYLRPLLGKNGDISRNGVLIYKRYQTEEAKAKDGSILNYSDLSKSFFTNDLKMVTDAISSDTYGNGNSMQQAVVDYIVGPYAEIKPETGWIDFSKRTDLRQLSQPENLEKQMDFFSYHLEVAHAPLGKWPSKYMPALMQQLAINAVMQRKETGGIFSVNGPPGTGKTTMLKEIIAGNIVERAKRLCTYTNPDEAFVKKKFFDGEKADGGYNSYHRYYYEFKDSRIKDYGILVASCNNAAVENITKELPDGLTMLKSLAAEENDAAEVHSGLAEVRALYEWQNGPDIYFTEYANDIAGKEAEQDWDRWGLISAPFGKTSNINEYIYKVLLPLERKEYYKNDNITKHLSFYTRSVEKFNNQLARVDVLRQEIRKISNARVHFNEKKAVLEAECKELVSEINKKMQLLRNLTEQANDLQIRIAEVEKEEYKAKIAVDSAKANTDEWQYNIQMLEEEIQIMLAEIIQLESRLGIKDAVRALFKKASTLSKTIHEKQTQLAQKRQVLTGKKEGYEDALTVLRHMEETYRELVTKINRFNHNKQACEKSTKENLAQIENAQQKIAAAKYRIQKEETTCRDVLRIAKETEEILGQMTVMDDVFWDMYNSKEDAASTKAHIDNPWFTFAYNREREKLFYEALQVHKYFLLASKHCRDNIKNLLVLWRINGDDDKKPVQMSRRDRENCFAALLNTVFLLTPVLSTTFASVGTMLADIKKSGEIGLLIIDEAGQAGPQMAIGALYRCRRAVVVGDPKQVEPVVTNEMDAIKRIIRNDSNILYQSKTHSVQAFSDRINPIGQNISDAGGESKTWVGCPLVVHRRCLNPMYEISNTISYDGTMKQQTPPPQPEKTAFFCLPGSQWINVCGSANNSKAKDHYVKTQGERAIEFIKLAFSKSMNIPSLYIITPFTSVKHGLLTALEELPEYRSDSRIKAWAEDHIGTVHTFQGKEADEVIFLLGCDKNALSAVRWVNTNIVNVAVTRAKYRFYILGDYAVWQNSYVMRQTKRIMDSHALRELSAFAQTKVKADAHKIEDLLGQVPNAETFQAGDDIGDELVASFQDALNDIWKDGDSITEEQLKSLNLSVSFMDRLAPTVRQSMSWAIKLYYLFGMLTRRYEIKHMDFSCAGILFCKSMELHLKECMLDGLQNIFPDIKVARGKFSDLNKQQAMLGVYTTILENAGRREQLAEKGLAYNMKQCDAVWWEQYYNDLDAFRKLRNQCCHPGKFVWDDLSSLLKILFIGKEFHKTLVGKNLPS